MLGGRRFVALVNGEVRAPVVFGEDKRVDGPRGPHGLPPRGADDDGGFAGLYTWGAHPTRHHLDACKTVRRRGLRPAPEGRRGRPSRPACFAASPWPARRGAHPRRRGDRWRGPKACT